MGAEMSPGAERRASNSATNSAPNEKDAQNSSAKAGFEARTPRERASRFKNSRRTRKTQVPKCGAAACKVRIRWLIK